MTNVDPRSARRDRRHRSASPRSKAPAFKLKRTIGGWSLDYLDPFLLLDHFESDDPPITSPASRFTRTAASRPSRTCSPARSTTRTRSATPAPIGPGDVQWMTAGGGLLHEEMPRPRDGKMGGFQLWVNMPAVQKMSRPRYQDVPAASIPVVSATTARGCAWWPAPATA